MKASTRKFILRANVLWLGVASFVSFFALDIAGIFFGKGPEAKLVGSAPFTGIGFLEAHGLASFSRCCSGAPSRGRDWHPAGAAAMALLGTSNLVFWPIFTATGSLAMGYVTTSMYWIMAAAQIGAAWTATTGR